MERMKPLETIKSEKECQQKEAELVKLRKEYGRLNDRDEFLKESEAELKTLLKQLSPDMKHEDERNLLAKINQLQIKCARIKNNTYGNVLLSHMRIILIQIEQYKALGKEYSFGQLIKGVITRNPEILKYLQCKYLIANVNRYGGIPNVVDFNRETPEEILNYIAKNYELVGIQPEVNNSLVPVDRQNKNNPTMEYVQDLVNECVQDPTPKSNKKEVPKGETNLPINRQKKPLRENKPNRENGGKEIE